MVSQECPVSYATGESRSMVEQFLAERESPGVVSTIDRPARKVDAFRVLEREWKAVRESASGE